MYLAAATLTPAPLTDRGRGLRGYFSLDSHAEILNSSFGLGLVPGDSYKSVHCAALELPAPGAMAPVRSGEKGGRGFDAALAQGAL